MIWPPFSGTSALLCLSQPNLVSVKDLISGIHTSVGIVSRRVCLFNVLMWSEVPCLLLKVKWDISEQGVIDLQSEFLPKAGGRGKTWTCRVRWSSDPGLLLPAL